MPMNEEETRFHLIDPVLRDKGYDERRWLKCETPAPVEPTAAVAAVDAGRAHRLSSLCAGV